MIEHLLQNARSDAVREQFLSQPVEDYTAVHSLKLLVNTLDSQLYCTRSLGFFALAMPNL